MKRNIVRLWVEYKSDESPYQYIEPISVAEAKIRFEEFLECQEERNNPGSYENITPTQKNNRLNRNYISKERIDQLEEITQRIDHEYKENQHMSPEEREHFISDGFE